MCWAAWGLRWGARLRAPTPRPRPRCCAWTGSLRRCTRSWRGWTGAARARTAAGPPRGCSGPGGRRRAAEGGALLAWTARGAGDAQQELRAYATEGRWRTRPYLDGPAG